MTLLVKFLKLLWLLIFETFKNIFTYWDSVIRLIPNPCLGLLLHSSSSFWDQNIGAFQWFSYKWLQCSSTRSSVVDRTIKTWYQWWLSPISGFMLVLLVIEIVVWCSCWSWHCCIEGSKSSIAFVGLAQVDQFLVDDLRVQSSKN